MIDLRTVFTHIRREYNSFTVTSHLVFHFTMPLFVGHLHGPLVCCYRNVSEVRTASIISVMTLTIEAVRTSETSGYSSETIRRYIPEGSHLQVVHVRCRLTPHNLKVYVLFFFSLKVGWV
jgi:hypothetical protein